MPFLPSTFWRYYYAHLAMAWAHILQIAPSEFLIQIHPAQNQGDPSPCTPLLRGALPCHRVLENCSTHQMKYGNPITKFYIIFGFTFLFRLVDSLRNMLKWEMEHEYFTSIALFGATILRLWKRNEPMFLWCPLPLLPDLVLMILISLFGFLEIYLHQQFLMLHFLGFQMFRKGFSLNFVPFKSLRYIRSEIVGDKVAHYYSNNIGVFCNRKRVLLVYELLF